MGDRFYSSLNMPSVDDDDEENDLSKDIALAVASILAESERYHQRSSSEVSIDFDSLVANEEPQLPRSKSSAGEKRAAKGPGKLKVKKTEKSRTTKSKSNVKLTNSVIRAEDSGKLGADVENQSGPVNEEQVLDDVMVKTSEALIKWPSPAAQPPPAVIPRNATMMDISLYLGRVQTYINQLGYQRQGEPRIKVNTQMSVKHLLDTAKSIIKAGEQIKCLHALILAIHFTNCTQIIERFPINFKSEFNGKEYKHVVLGIYLYGYFGALGISRDNGLQDKPASFARLSDMINDFHSCYAESMEYLFHCLKFKGQDLKNHNDFDKAGGHTLLEVKIGGIVTHDPYSLEPIPWKLHLFNVKKLSDVELVSGIERCAKLLRSKMGAYCLRNIRPIGAATADTTSNTNTASKLSALHPSVSNNANSINVTRSRKAIKSKYNNVDIRVNASASVGSRLLSKK